jgi:hypothetical protein
MFPRHVGYEFAILAAVCALGIFLFPATSGPYSAVHGPVTALLSSRAKLKLCSGLAIAGLSLRWHFLLDGCAALSGLREKVGLPNSVSPEQISVLRC